MTARSNEPAACRVHRIMAAKIMGFDCCFKNMNVRSPSGRRRGKYIQKVYKEERSYECYNIRTENVKEWWEFFGESSIPSLSIELQRVRWSRRNQTN